MELLYNVKYMDTKKDIMEKEVHQLVENSFGSKFATNVIAVMLTVATAGIIGIAAFLWDMKGRIPLVEQRTTNMENAMGTMQNTMNTINDNVQQIKQNQAVNQATVDERFRSLQETTKTK